MKLAFAGALGVSRQTLHEIMTLKRGIPLEMAIRLEAVVESTAETWLALQSSYDLCVARQRANAKGLKQLAAASLLPTPARAAHMI